MLNMKSIIIPLPQMLLIYLWLSQLRQTGESNKTCRDDCSEDFFVHRATVYLEIGIKVLHLFIHSPHHLCLPLFLSLCMCQSSQG